MLKTLFIIYSTNTYNIFILFNSLKKKNFFYIVLFL